MVTLLDPIKRFFDSLSELVLILCLTDCAVPGRGRLFNLKLHIIILHKSGEKITEALSDLLNQCLHDTMSKDRKVKTHGKYGLDNLKRG